MSIGGYAMETYKLRIKIGNAEFEAEGPEQTVKEQFEAFKLLVESSPRGVNTTAKQPSTEPLQAYEPLEAMDSEDLRRLYLFSKSGDSLSLAFPPQGKDRQQQALLLILYGFKMLLGQDDASVGALKDSLEQSGFVVERVDRLAFPLTKAGLVWKGGKKGRGGKYRLTNLGVSQAQSVAKELLGSL